MTSQESLFSKYDVILADPPWSYSDRGASGSMKPSGAATHYSTMSNKQICRLDVGLYAARDSLLFMWVTAPQLPVGMMAMRAWGFTFKTVAFTWVKTGRTEPARLDASRLMRADGMGRGPSIAAAKAIEEAGLLMPKFPIGQGSYTRANPEFVLLGRRGNGVPRIDKGVRAEVLAKRGPHSAKPDEVQTRIERLVGDAPKKIELFARRRRPGWDAWGNEIDSDVNIEVAR